MAFRLRAARLRAAESGGTGARAHAVGPMKLRRVRRDELVPGAITPPDARGRVHLQLLGHLDEGEFPGATAHYTHLRVGTKER